jgi:uncharacterized protein YhdP
VLDFSSRRLNDVALRAGATAADCERLLKGLPAKSPGVLKAAGASSRLETFQPARPTPGRTEAPARDLPALDIISDNLIVNNNDLGRLELVAVNQALDWNIEKLVLTAPESTLSVEGVWQGQASRPSVNLKTISLKVSDVGKYLDRMGYPGTMRRGTATLTGNLSWAGSPLAIDYPTLAGHLEFEAKRAISESGSPVSPASSGFSACSPGSRWISASFSAAASPSISFRAARTSPTAR